MRCRTISFDDGLGCWVAIITLAPSGKVLWERGGFEESWDAEAAMFEFEMQHPEPVYPSPFDDVLENEPHR